MDKLWRALALGICLAGGALGAQQETLVPDGPLSVGDADTSGVSVASNARGDTVLAWSAGGDIFVERRDAAGEAIGEISRIDSGEGFLDFLPAVAMDAAGGVHVVAWLSLFDFGGVPPPPELLIQRFDRLGRPLGGPARAFQRLELLFPAVAMDADGSFVVLGLSLETVDVRRVLLQRFDPQGQAVGEVLSLSPAVPGSRISAPRAAFNNRGELFVLWTRFTCGADGCLGFRVEGRRLTAGGEVAGPVLEVTDQGAGASLATLPSGDFLVVWNRPVPNDFALFNPVSFGVRGRRVTASGLGPEVALKAEEDGALRAFAPAPALAVDALGEGVVLWEDENEGSAGSGLFGQLLDSQLRLRGDRFRLQEDLEAENLLPVVAATSAGRFLAAWIDYPGPQILGPLARRKFRREGSGCLPEPTRLCLSDRRFQLTGTYRTRAGVQGPIRFVSLSDDSAAGWLFRPDNVEMLLKVLDGRSVNGFFWFFYAGLTNVEVELTLRDLSSGGERTYLKPQGELISFADTRSLVASSGGGFLGSSAWRAQTSEDEVEPVRAGPARVTPGPCVPGPRTACLGEGRFAVELLRTGEGGDVVIEVPVQPLTDSAGAFWFSRPSNLEVVVKVIDGRAVNGSFWVFYGTATNLPFTLQVTDTDSGVTRTYEKAAGPPSSFADTEAFHFPGTFEERNHVEFP